MKKLLVLVGLAGLLCAPALQAATVTIGRTAGTYQQIPFFSGGEFSATPTAPDLAWWTTVHGDSSPFQTFCVETDEYISIGGQYQVAISRSAWHGGSGGSEPDPISRATAWLFSQFDAGTLSGYNYAAGLAHEANATALQQAFWILEQEAAIPIVANTWVNLAMQAGNASELGYSSVADARADNADGAFDVRVLRLGPGAVNQDMLVTVVPEPTTMIAGALLLLPFGVSTLRILRKKYTA